MSFMIIGNISAIYMAIYWQIQVLYCIEEASYTNLCLSSRLIHLLCSDGVASPSEWLLNPDRSIRSPKASGPCPGMRWQNSGENPGENCEGEHLNVLLALLLSGKHLGGESKPAPTDNHSLQLWVGLRADINFTLFNSRTPPFLGHQSTSASERSS